MRIVFGKKAKLAKRKRDLKNVTEFYTEARGYTYSAYLMKDNAVLANEITDELLMQADFCTFLLYQHILIKR